MAHQEKTHYKDLVNIEREEEHEEKLKHLIDFKFYSVFHHSLSQNIVATPILGST